MIEKRDRHRLSTAAAQREKEREYWLNRLAGELVKSRFPYDRPRMSRGEEPALVRAAFTWKDELFRQLIALSRGSPYGLHVLLLSGLALVLHRYDYRLKGDILMGTPIYKQKSPPPAAGKQGGNKEEYINTLLPLRVQLEEQAAFREIMQRTRQAVSEAVENQAFPMEILAEDLGIPGDEEFPFFDTALLLENIHHESYIRPARPGVLFIFVRNPDGLSLEIQYDCGRYYPGTIERIARHYARAMEIALEDIHRETRTVDILSPEEKQHLVHEFNHTDDSCCPDKTIHGLFEEQAERTPDHIAVKEAHELHELHEITYSELNRNSNRLAGVLKEKGVGAGDIVAILMERSLEMVVGLLGILKAGAAYLPIDPAYPQERIDYMLKDSGAKILLSELSEVSGLSKEPTHLTHLTHPTHLCYVIYTSGTTGRPKGVAVGHRGLVNLIYCHGKVFKEGNRVRVSQVSSPGFDAMAFEVWPCLAAGAVLVVVPGRIRQDPEKMRDWLIRECITISFQPTPMAEQLLDVEWPERGVSLCALRAAGDRLTRYPQKPYPFRLYNLYGPTEDTVWTTWAEVGMDAGQGILPPIGKPIANHRVYILDPCLRLQPVGAPGELCICGVGLAAGYLNNPELTAGKFIGYRSYRTYRTYSSKKIYKTGDLARWLGDGNIEFLGRIDTQIKIRGFRIELEEIQVLLAAHPHIREAVVADRVDTSGNKYLCAYVRAAAEGDDLRAYLSQRLPEFMIPSFFVYLEKIPLDSSGKVDRKRLPEPGGLSTAAYSAPTTEVEARVVEIFKAISMNAAQIGIDDDFFHLGGDSIKAIQVAARLKKMGLHLEISDIFTFRTARRLAAVIKSTAEDSHPGIVPVEKREYYPLSPAQKRLYVLHRLEPESTRYNIPAVLEAAGPVCRERLENVFKTLIRRHESFRTSFRMKGEEPVQRIHEEENYQFQVTNYKQITNSRSKLIEDFVRPFDLSRAPLLRVGVVQAPQGESPGNGCILMLDMHHIVADGLSQAILLREFSGLYRGETLPPLELHYKDYACRQQARQQAEVLQKQRQYWVNRFSGEIPVLYLPLDFPRPAMQRQEGAHLVFTPGKEESTALIELAGEQEVTLFMVLFAVFNVWLSRLSGQEELVTGTPAAGRRQVEVQPIIGMFVNTLALENAPKGEKTFRDFLQEVKTGLLAAVENQDYPFEELVEAVTPVRDPARNPLFDVVFVMQNVEIPDLYRSGLMLKTQPVETGVSKFDLTLEAVETADGIYFTVEYCTALFKENTVQRWTRYFRELVSSILEDPGQPISRLNILPPKERRQILVEFNDTAASYPEDKTIRDIFSRQVQKTPDTTAVVKDGVYLTYGELNAVSSCLAGRLRSRGAGTGGIVGIVGHRSLEMVVGILAVLKAGGVYLPVDADYPGQRIRYLLEDANARVVLFQPGSVNIDAGMEMNREMIPLDPGAPGNPTPTGEIEIFPDADAPAYIMYTSGSTGRPRGVMIRHRSVLRLVCDPGYVTLNAETRILQTGAPVFDAVTFEIWGSLLNGGQLVLVDKTILLDAYRLENVLKDHHINTLWLSSPLFNRLVQENSELFSPLRQLLVGGDVLSSSHIDRVRNRFPHLSVINGYGPTENTTFSTTFLITGTFRQQIPIGRPIRRSTAYVVDRFYRLQPVGVPGELLVGGDGVASGYLNNPELTAEKFIGYRSYRTYRTYISKKIYKTGDLARWLPDGNIEFLGRLDQQVKIRGFRVELGEIEHCLVEHKKVEGAVVMTREDNTGSKYLCAYLVPDHREKPMSGAQLRDYLAALMPDYMIPSYFVFMDKFPLTPNGKIDYRQLPEPGTGSGEAYAPPGDEIEGKLVEVFTPLLRGGDSSPAPVGIDDDFFLLGGDSIKAIQVAARLKSFGLKLDIKDLFLHRTIRRLRPHVQPDRENIPQEPVEGNIPLTPIQHWFFQVHTGQPHHFNQAVTLFKPDRLDETLLREVFREIVLHHDALRMVYRYEGNEIRQINRGVKESEALFHLEVHDCAGEPGWHEHLDTAAETLHSGIDLSQGPLLKSALCRTAAGDYLLIVIHHLVVDGVSWRILLEDISNGYEQAAAGKTIRFPAKTHSFQYWSQCLEEYAGSAVPAAEIPYWNRAASPGLKPLPAGGEPGSGQMLNQYGETVELAFSEAGTARVLNRVHTAYNTRINDILLAALVLAIEEWAGVGEVLVNLEGHGREPIIKDVDIGRTVGWFTVQYPVLLSTGPAAAGKRTGKNLAHAIKTVKETLHRVPAGGIGYGVLRYLTPIEKKGNFMKGPDPEVSFNYLGQFDTVFQAGADNIPGMRVTRTGTGSPIGPLSRMLYALDINGMVVEGQLRIALRYNRFRFHRDRVEQLAEAFKAALRDIVDHCLAREGPEFTPGDVVKSGRVLLDIDELDQLVQFLRTKNPRVQIQKIYSLSPMQEGMLFHAVTDSESGAYGAYFEQNILDIAGNMDSRLLEESFKVLGARYDIFRTVFRFEKVKQPLQVVLAEMPVKIKTLDIAHLGEKEKETYLEAFNAGDRKEGFDLTCGPLLRLTLIKTNEDRYRLIWDFHHILLDGWCMPVLYRELLRIYAGLAGGRVPALEPVFQYSRYIDWLEAQDKAGGLRYWQQYLEGYECLATLPKLAREHGEKPYEAAGYRLELGERINRGARESGVTINTILQTLWGLLLQRYNNTRDVVFGAVVSGRSAEIEGIEHMVGLFINTVPVRIRSEKNQTLTQLLETVQQQAVQSRAYEYLPLAEIQGNSALKELIDHILVFENYPVETAIKEVETGETPAFHIEKLQMREQTNYDLNIIAAPGQNPVVRFNFNASVYEPLFIEKIAHGLRLLLEQAVRDFYRDVDSLEILGEKEKRQILFDFNDTEKDYPEHKTIYQLFEEQVERTPDYIAVKEAHELHELHEITYCELNRRADRLAAFLTEKGVLADSIVGITMPPCIEMIIGIMGILKAGGAYLPIDPEYPQERIDYMLKDSNAVILLTRRELADICKGTVYRAPTISPATCNLHPSLAYIIYTSGSTGWPKGVGVSHRSLVNLCYWHNFRFGVRAADRASKFAGFGFDASVWEIFPYLIMGASLYLVPEEIKTDIETLDRYFETHHITIAFLPTAFCEAFMELENRSLRVLLTGADKLKRFKKRAYLLVNNYGPTENTVVSTSFAVEREEANIPIGKPIFNQRVYILDVLMRLQPIGAPGELCIAGAGLAAGYLNNPELTAEKFVFLYRSYRSYGSYRTYISKKIYKTGDLARWRSDGNIQFLGRIDNQVKIRGYRIEPGEIEALLEKHETIEQAVVIACRDAGGIILCAYIVFIDVDSAAAERVPGIKKYLAGLLPSYMIPAYFIPLETIPVTPNGKVDRKALPEPDFAVSAVYQAPGDTVQERMVEIWREVLGITARPPGIDDDFFHLGGDSIKAIQVASRLKKYGLKLEVKDLFQYKTIRESSRCVRVERDEIPQEAVVGEAGLTPIQHWFFQEFTVQPHHFNMPVTVVNPRGFDEGVVRRVFAKILEHHDALRMVFRREDNKKIRQINREAADTDTAGLFHLEIHDLRHLEDWRPEMETLAAAIQASIDLTGGPLVKLGLFRAAEGDYLLMVIHHLVVDGVSWRILLEDFFEGYERVLEGKPIRFPRKTHSFLHWQHCLEEYSRTPALLKEIAYWNRIADAGLRPLPGDGPGKTGAAQAETGGTVNLELAEEETRQLLGRVHEAFHTQINDILLTALALAVESWAGIGQVLILLEGHGREPIVNNVDIGRTLGWFTNRYPVLLTVDPQYKHDLSFIIKSVKETLRAVPNNGTGYGILRYLTPPEMKMDFKVGANPEISFNYLGQWGQGDEDDMAGQRGMKVTQMGTGAAVGPGAKTLYALNINGWTAGGRLQVAIQYDRDRFRGDRIENVAALFKSFLKEIIAYCTSGKEAELTPSDLLESENASLDVEELESLGEFLDMNIDE